MKCLQCQSLDTKVIESREVGDGIATRRRRECEGCLHRFTTYERIEQPQVVIVKNNGNRELFSRDKLMKGLLRACGKTPVTSLQLETLVSDIEILPELQTLSLSAVVGIDRVLLPSFPLRPIEPKLSQV